MKKKIGIWIDKKTAKIVTIENGEVEMVSVNSNLEEYHPKGGSGTKMKGGPQDVIQDSRYLEREKNQLKVYFTNLTKKLLDVESIVVFGPAQTGKKFADELSKNHKNLYRKILDVKSADSMTDNQIIAWVKEYFD